MASTRVRFTISYIALSMGVVIVFAIVLYFSRLGLAQGQLYDQAVQFADGILRDIRVSRQNGYPLITQDSTLGGANISRELRFYLERRSGYFMVYGADTVVPIYNSAQVRGLSPIDGDSLTQYALRLRNPSDALKVTLVADTANLHKLFIIAR